MSRRKQAKPRPIFVYEEEVTDVHTEEVYDTSQEPEIYETSQESAIYETSQESVEFETSQEPAEIHENVSENQEEEQEDFGEFAPLIMDTSSQDDGPLNQSPTQSPSSIKPIENSLVQNSQGFTPEPIKPFTTKDPAFLFAQSQSHMDGKKLSSLSRFNAASSFAAALSASNSNDSLSLGTAFQSQHNSDDGSSVSDSISVPTSPSVVRRGSKRSDTEPDENGVNLDIDPDFDDLEELLKELIKDKILPISDENGEKFICPVCNCSLLTLHDLTVHIRSHNTPASGTQSNTCKICAKVLSSQSSLDRHMLVHSGERPFVCKVCNMSFTTNGNMHRHARIHTKEENMNALGSSQANKFQMRRSKTAWRQRLGQYLTQNNSPVADRIKPLSSQELLQTLPNHSQRSLFGRPTENLPSMVPNLKRQYSNGPDSSPDWSIPFKRQSLENNNDIYKTYNYTLNTCKEEEPEQIKQEVPEETESKTDKDVLHCPVCSKTFLCKNGLENHLETHPDFVCHCSICNLTFENPRKLRVHRLIAHSDVSKEDSSKGDSENDDDIEIGFHDLSFVDFSVDKFPLIAKHYFEENARIPSSVYLNFTCKKCSKAFPCETSLYLHSFSHTKDKSTQCPICESDYTSSAELHNHMLKHLADRAFEEIRPSSKNEKGDNDVMPDSLLKHDFLAMFGLKEEENRSDMKPVTQQPKREQSKSSKSSEKKINNEYFSKLGQIFGAGLPPLFSQLPFFPPGYQPTLDDFHKMLQIATNMTSLPSMGPGLLMKGLPGAGGPSPSKLPSESKSLNDEPPKTSPLPAHSKSGKRAGLLSSPKLEDRQSLSGPEKEINDIKLQNTHPWPCRYCDSSFTSYKSLEAHITTHLVHAPYKCNLCVYSSPDRSSLIRHIRTHTGSRPFQCLECDYAFSTRGNCERHIRKQHHIERKEDIERCIYFNRNALQYDTGKLRSPDTVCKYCSTDFKYFQALKNHLQSPAVSKEKPYQCVLCKIGFCAKSLCVRHIHKSHPEVSEIQTDAFIKVVFDVDSKDVDTSVDDGIPLYSIETPEFFSHFNHRSENGTPQPPAAHSTPKPDSLVGRTSRHVSPKRHVSPSRHISPNRHISPKAHISPSESPMFIKKEVEDDSVETPLDFSKTAASDPVDMSNSKDKVSAEAPMDLSCKKSTTPERKEYSSSDLASFERRMQHQHGHVPFSESSVSSHFSAFPLWNTEGKLLLPPRSSVSPFQSNPATGLIPSRVGSFQPKGKMPVSTLQSLQDKIKMNLKHDNLTRSPSGMDCDLSSVRKMIDVTDPLNFKAFFNQDQQVDKTPQNKPRRNMPNILKRPGVQISLEHCNAINRELDNLQREGDVDEVALSQVREMALSVKEECVNNAQTTPSSTVQIAPAPTNPSASPPSSDVQQEDENSGDGSLSGKKSDGDLTDTAPVKKKRNSYADSPHKLSCPYCPRAFPWVSSLTRHLLTHTGQKPFKCPRCPVTFSTKSNRERHLIRKHGVNMLDPMSRQTMDRPYKCPLCVFSSFSTQSNLLKHYRDRHNGINLPDNIADIERMSPAAIQAATLEMESRAAENPPQLDEASALNLATEEDEDEMDNSLDSDEKMDDEMSYTEAEMPEELPRPDSGSEVSESSLTSVSTQPVMADKPLELAVDKPKIAPHLLMKMQELKNFNEEDPVEKIIARQEVNKEEERKAQKEEERKAQEHRPESPNTMAANIERIIAEQRRIIEQKAQMEMKIQAEIRAQIEAQRKAEIQPMSQTAVDVSMDGLKLLKDPAKSFTGSAERIINPERDNYDVDKITQCWKCKSVFPSRKVLVRHLKEHNIDLPYKCYLCDASFDARSECLHHQARSHSSDWKILKDKNKVIDIDNFATHMEKVVENNCNKLDSGSVLEIPGTGMDESKMEVISADYMQRKVYCSLCPKRFWSLQDLRRHMRSHTGERPFECDICQKRFTLKHSMMRHRKKHIGAPPRSFDDDEDSNGIDGKGSRIAKPTPSRPPNMHLFQTGIPFTTTLSSEGMPLANTFLFSPGLSGGTLRIGSSPLAALTVAPVSTPQPAPQSPKPGVSAVNSNVEKSPESPASGTPRSVSPTVATVDSVKKEFLNCNADMLHNLLGVESSEIEKMLDSADSKTAAKFLGVTEVSMTCDGPKV